MGEHLLRNADAIITHAHHHLSGIHIQPQADLPLRGRVFHGIVKEIEDHWREACGITMHPSTQRGQLQDELVSVAFQFCAHRSHR